MASLVRPPQSGHLSLLVAAAGNSTVFRAGAALTPAAGRPWICRSGRVVRGEP
jgi:hypothetical protein